MRFGGQNLDLRGIMMSSTITATAVVAIASTTSCSMMQGFLSSRVDQVEPAFSQYLEGISIAQRPSCEKPLFELAGALAMTEGGKIKTILTKKLVGAGERPEVNGYIDGDNFTVGGEPVAEGPAQTYKVIVIPDDDNDKRVLVAKATQSLSGCNRR